jgi:hypothetical protein
MNELFPSMTKTEARGLVERIRSHITDARRDVLELYEREGWRVLGYDSWRDCVVTEFEQSQRHLYRLLDAAKVERNLSQVFDNQQNDCPIGQMPEGVLRPLSKLKPDQQREAWKAATAVQPQPTAAFVAKVAETIKRNPTAEQRDFEALAELERERQRRATATRLFESALVFFTPHVNPPEQIAKSLLTLIDPSLITKGWLTKKNLTEAVRVFSLIAAEIETEDK